MGLQKSSMKVSLAYYLLVYNRGGQTFLLTGQISLKYYIAGRKNFFCLFFLKYDMIDVC